MYSDPDPPRSSPSKPSSLAGTTTSSPSAAAAPPTLSAPPQELTLSYLCDKDTADAAFTRNSNKGKEVAIAAESLPREHDFLQLGPAGGNKRREGCAGGIQLTEPDEKKPRLGSLNLSLSLNSADPVPGCQPGTASVGTAHPVQVKRSYSANTRTNTVNSDDFNPSLSYSYSTVPFSHNPSCSLTHNTTENFDFSRENNHNHNNNNEQIWHAGEGTNGSVHSKFKPIGESIVFASATQPPVASSSSFFNNNNNNSISFFPSELPARPPAITTGTLTPAKLNNSTESIIPNRILREIVSESIPSVASKLESLSPESLESLRESARALTSSPDRKVELASLQRKLDRRSDLTLETLTSKTHKTQLEILVSLKSGLPTFLSPKSRLPQNELAEMYLLQRCRNLTCKSLLPVDDCDCKICSSKKGFCSACMCPVCFKFDSSNNTCSWVGCDVCSHWSHASCGISRNLIRPGPTLKGPVGTTEMQFQCLGCGHASEMLGFVKEVFNCCGKLWEEEVLKKELECVARIFEKSEDFEGKGVCQKARELAGLLGRKGIRRENACETMLDFFKYGATDYSVTKSSKSVPILSQAPPEMSLNPSKPFSFSPPTPPNPSLNLPNPNLSSSEEKSLETVVKCKEAEAKLFQRLADDARREVEKYREIVRAQAGKIEEEYGASLARLCLKEAEERRRKKIEELKMLENSQGDYQKMKMRMQTEIASLLERMEATKQMWV